MPRRQQPRRPAFRGPRNQSRGQDDSAQQATDAAARSLLARYDAAALEGMLGDLRELCAQADQQAIDQPSSEALSQYRRAARELKEVERALALAGHSERTGPPDARDG